MIHAIACFVAEGVTTDAETKQVSAFGLVENVQASSFPVVLRPIVFFCMWERALKDFPKCGVELSVALNGKELARQVVDLDFAQFLRTRSTIRFEGLALAEPGNLVFRMAIPGNPVAEWVVEASVASHAATGTVGPAGTSRLYDSGQFSVLGGSVNVNRR